MNPLLQLDLFSPDTGTIRPAEIGTRRRKPQVSKGWELSDHACRQCLGRVLQRRLGGVVVEARCAECGSAGSGGAASICCCGAEAGTLGKILECFRNPDITPAVPQEVLVRERPVTEKPSEQRRVRPVGMREY
jgi:hypothetical protein